MSEIDEVQRSPLDQIVVDFFRTQRSGLPSIDFCHRLFGVPESSEVVAGRLKVAVSTVRGWREVGRRAANGGTCLQGDW